MDQVIVWVKFRLQSISLGQGEVCLMDKLELFVNLLVKFSFWVKFGLYGSTVSQFL